MAMENSKRLYTRNRCSKGLYSINRITVKNEIFNVGTGTNISVNDVVKIIKEFKLQDVQVINEEKQRIC